MRSTRLATAAVTAGAALLGWSTVGVSAIGGQLSAAAPEPAQQQQRQQEQQLWPDRHDHDDVGFEQQHHRDHHPGV